jgi:hypothetical protein
MEFWKAILGLVSRKIIVIPLLGAAIALALTGYFLTPLSYVSTTTMVLVKPAFGGTLSQDPSAPTDLTNPMLGFSTDLKVASAILIHVMNTREAAAELGAVKGGPTKVTIDDGRTNPNLLDSNGPFVYVVGESPSKAEAKAVVMRAQARMRQELIDRQRSLRAPQETYLTMVDVVPPTTPEVTRAHRIKISGIAFVVSLVFGLCIAYALQRTRVSHLGRLAGELPVKHQENELDSSREKLHEDPDRATEDGSADRRARTADTSVAAGELRLEEGKQELEVRGSAEPQSAGTEHVADAVQRPQANAEAEPSSAPEQVAYAGTEHVADAVQKRPQANEPEQVAYASQHEQLRSQEEEASEVWDLYIAEYPPANAEAMRSSEDDELDWSLDWNMNGLESERDSAVVGYQRSV